jgi:hypothetical protein
MVNSKKTLSLSFLGCVMFLSGYSQVFAVDVVGTLIKTTQTSQFSPPSPDPCGLAYQSSTDRLIISDPEVEEIPPGHPGSFQGANVFEATRAGALVRTGNVTSYTNEPSGVAFNPSNGHFFFADDDRDEIYEVDPGSDGFSSNDVVTHFDTNAAGNIDPEGAAYGAGTLFISDGTNAEIYKYQPGPNGVFNGVSAAGGDDQVTHCDTSSYVTVDEGLEFDAATGHFFITGRPETHVFETTTDCALLRTIDVTVVNPRKTAGLAIAPGSANDPNPTTSNIYIVDKGRDDSANIDENDGKLYEFDVPPLAGAGNQPPVVMAGSDQTVDLAAGAILDGTVTDDGQPNPPGLVTTTWSQLSGPGTVTFANPSSVDTTASFSALGTYVLRLTASDSQLSNSDDVTITVQSTTPTGFATIYVSAATGGTALGVAFKDEDIIAFNTNSRIWSLFFDGSDVGLASEDVDAFDIMADGSILLSLTADGVSIPNVGLIDDSDIVRFIPTALGATTAGTFELYFDGSDVGLTTSDEDVDAIGFLPDGRLVISTLGPSATGVSGADEDLLAFTATNLGATTSGTFALHFDGSDVNLSQSSSEDVDGTWIDNAATTSGHIYLTTLGTFSVPGVTGDGADIFRCIPGSTGATTSCTYDLTFDGSANGLAGELVDGMELAR